MSGRAKQSLLALACISVAITALPGAANAGFFEALFGHPAPPAPVFLPPPAAPDPAEIAREEARRRAREAARQAAIKKARDAAAARILAMQSADPGSLDVFLADDTLRPGDVVVTQAGFLVFQGNARSDHDAADFAPIADVRQMKNRADLIALQNAAKLARPPVAVATNAPVPGFKSVASAEPAFRGVGLAVSYKPKPVPLDVTSGSVIR